MKKLRYVVETRMMYGWENVWVQGLTPTTFATREEAQAEIDDHIKTQRHLRMTVDELRIVPEPVDVQATWLLHGWVRPDRARQFQEFSRLNDTQK